MLDFPTEEKMNKNTYILASLFTTNEKDENDIRHPIMMQDTNGILSTIKKYVSNRTNFVMVANDPDNFEDNDDRINVMKQSFEMSNIAFENYAVLDNRNFENAKDLLLNASMIYLTGGEIIREKNFIEKINFKKILEQTHCLILGTSAGAMNLCNKIYNFPETLAGLDEPRIVEGLGIWDNYLIPHFDGEGAIYQLPIEEIDVVNDYVLPFSEKEKLIGIDNDAYILLDGENQKFYGKHCIIHKGKITNFED